jgi:hypothetical protein
MTLQEIKTKVDNFLADLWVNKIVPKQEAYFAKHGRYAQVLTSPEIMPADDTEGTYVKRPPSDEQNPADFEFEIATPIPAQLEIHTHDKGNQHGFTAHVWVEVQGKIYHRAKNYQFGGEDVAWHEVINEEI